MKKVEAFLLSITIIFGMAFFAPKSFAEEVINDHLLTPEEIKTNKILASPSIDASVEGVVNCFNYYKFGSVQVEVSSLTGSTVSGVPLTLRGKIKNTNNYPVVGGSLYVKIFKKQSDLEKVHANGFFLMDQFVAKEDISMAANETKEIFFDYNVPRYATDGDYQIATFFLSAKKFNLLGLSFTDDVVGGIFNFTINGEVQDGVWLDKNNTSINDINYHFAAFPPRTEKDQEVTIKTNLQNTTKEVQSIPVTWTLYSWDGQQETNIINTKTETIAINPNENKEIFYSTTDSSSPVYFLVIEAKYKDTKSLLDVRFVRNGVDKVRINFPAMLSYPLKANESNTVFSCLHNSGQSSRVENNKMVLTLSDENNQIIHTYTYEGAVSGEMMGVKDDFVPKEDYSNFTLKAELYTDNKLVDSAQMQYSCSDIDEKTCLAKKDSSVSAVSSTANSNNNSMIIIIAAIAGLLIVSVLVVLKRRNLLGGGMKAIGLLFLLGTGLFLFGYSDVQAADPSVTFTASEHTVSAGDSVTLRWSTTDAHSCRAGGYWSGDKSSDGSEVVRITSDESFSLECWDSRHEESTRKIVRVTVSDPPTLTLDASEYVISFGSPITLSWSATNVDSCTASDGWDGDKNTEGNEVVNIDETKSFSLRCRNDDNGISIRKTVRIIALAPIYQASNTQSNIFNESTSSMLTYYWNRWAPTGWCNSVSGNINASATYSTVVRNLTQGGVNISNGDSVAVGDVLQIASSPLVDSDIWWVTTGYSSDSPYGHWTEDAGPPSDGIKCNAGDYVSTATFPEYGAVIDMYLYFSVKKPTITRSLGGTAMLNCSSVNDNCIVAETGNIIARFDYGNTFGKVYHRYHDNRNLGGYGGPGCYGNDVPLRLGDARTTYIQNIPAQAMEYNITSEKSTVLPSVALRGPGKPIYYTDVSYEFEATSEDPDPSNTVRYRFDIDNDDIANLFKPADGELRIPAGSPQTLAYSWSQPGWKEVRVMACNNKALCSPWSRPASIYVEKPACTPIDPVGNKPDAHSNMCSNDDMGLTEHIPKTLESSCAIPKKCKYVCDNQTNAKCNSGTSYRFDNSGGAPKCAPFTPNCCENDTCIGQKCDNGGGAMLDGVKDCRNGAWKEENPN